MNRNTTKKEQPIKRKPALSVILVVIALLGFIPAIYFSVSNIRAREALKSSNQKQVAPKAGLDNSKQASPSSTLPATATPAPSTPSPAPKPCLLYTSPSPRD